MIDDEEASHEEDSQPKTKKDLGIVPPFSVITRLLLQQDQSMMASARLKVIEMLNICIMSSISLGAVDVFFCDSVVLVLRQSMGNGPINAGFQLISPRLLNDFVPSLAFFNGAAAFKVGFTALPTGLSAGVLARFAGHSAVLGAPALLQFVSSNHLICQSMHENKEPR
ncbi:unnamed protein product [Ilex paraguariensis]|uniref:Uncharacterized protein n=1 Tax=Ilex paraguariensis TaxID=185542 RepID=A0ABC8TVG5_9AQUA